MDIRIPKTRATSLLVLCVAAVFQPAQAWKVGTHVASGNQMLDDFAANGRTPLNMTGNTTIQFSDPLTGRQLSLGVNKKDALTAIRNWPEYFRGGLIGPDGFPDMVTGQLLEHGNQTPFIWKGIDLLKENGPATIKQYWTNYQVPDAYVSAVVLDQRATPSQFRSIDFAMSMFQEAKGYIEPVSVTTSGGWFGRTLLGAAGSIFGTPKTVTKTLDATEQQQILAFIIGYIGHCVGDGMGHTYINEYASGAWDYLAGQGLFGIETEEIKHVVTEGFIDKRIPGSLRSTTGQSGKDENRYTIAIPAKFLDKFFATRRANQNVGDRNGSPEQFLAAYTDIDQYYGGPFYSYFNMQVDAADHIEDWANARGFLDVVEDLDPYVSFLGAVDDLIESIPGWKKAQEFQNWAKGDLLEFLTMGKFNCSSPQNVDFFDVWKRLSSIRGNISKWKDHSEIVRRNWLMMSRCTAENLAKINGGKNTGNSTTYKDACVEMAAAPWSDMSGATDKSLYRGSIRGSYPTAPTAGETADQEFMRDMKEAFVGEPVSGKSFEQANQHRKAAANIERAFSYLLGVSITIDDLMEIFSVGSMQPTLDYYCGMADPKNQTDEAHRNCFNVSRRGELLLLLEAFCVYDAGKAAIGCIADMKDKWNDCKDATERWCRDQPLATITLPEVCAPRYCKRVFRKKFCIGGGCVGGGTYRNWVWLTPCYGTAYTACAAYDVVSTGICEVGVIGDFAGCSFNAIDKAVLSLNPFRGFFRQLDQGCDALEEAKKDIAIYRSLDTKEERDAYLRERGVPVDQINELKRVWADVMDKLADLPDVYMLNLVYLKEDLRDGQYLPIVKQQLEAAKIRIQNGNAQDKAEALALIDELKTLADDIAANRNAFHLPFAVADMSASIAKIPDATSRTSLQARLASMQTLVQSAKADPRQSGLIQRIDNEIALIESIRLKQAGTLTTEGYEQREAILQVMTDLRLFVQAALYGTSFNNYPLMKTTLTNLITSGTKSAGYAARAVEIIVDNRAIPEVAGPTAQKIIAQMGNNLPITFTPFYNTVQGLKVDAVISKSDWSNLFVQKGLSTGLLPWNKPKSPNDQRQLYSSICQDPSLAGWDAVSVYCDVLKSNDDPNCYGCTSPTRPKGDDESWEDYLKGASVYEQINQTTVWDWTRGIYAWSSTGAMPTTFTNFPLSSNEATYTSLYSNIFRNPNCNGSFEAMPASLELTVGSPFTLQATLASGSSPVQTYIWVKNGVEIAGGASPVFTKSSFQESDMGEYWVVGVTACGTRITSGRTMVSKKTLTSLYVDNAVAGGDGSSWAKAFSNLGDAIAAAGPQSTIHIAEGSYAAPNVLGTFKLADSMELLGGYAHGGATRDPSRYTTELRGGYFQSLITAENVNAVVDGVVLAAPMSDVYSVFSVTASSDKRLLVRNTTIRMESPSAYGRWGGYVSGQARLAMENVNIEGVQGANGLFFLSGAGASFTNVRFTANGTLGAGPLLYVNSGSLVLRNVLMTGNRCQSSMGGVIQISSGATLDASFLTIADNLDPSGVNFPKPSITGAGTGVVRNSIVWDAVSSSATSSPITFERSVAKGVGGSVAPSFDSEYRPLAGSSAKGIADPAEAGSYDLDGVMRPASPDAGALQGP